MRGFKEDFDAWRSSLTPEEQEMVQNQAAGEFNKKFRKSDEFKKDLPEEKVKSFSKILGKFFDAESEDYKKEVAAKVPNYNRLLKKAGDKVLDFKMSNRIVEVDRDADRRYAFATRRILAAKQKGEKFPQSSPFLEPWGLQNNDTGSHEFNKKVLAELEKASKEGNVPAETKAAVDALVKAGIPAMGEPFVLNLPQKPVNQIHYARNLVSDRLEESKADKGEFATKVWPNLVAEIVGNWSAANDEVEKDVNIIKKYFRAQTKDKYKTKADVLRALWAALPEALGKDVPPVDEELLAELEEVPAVSEDEFMHNWGTADRLYKSEAIDAFGMKYLLGVFDTVDEAKKAFTEWNDEYEKNRAEMKTEMAQWSKQENARLEADTSGSDRIQKILEEARR